MGIRWWDLCVLCCVVMMQLACDGHYVDDGMSDGKKCADEERRWTVRELISHLINTQTDRQTIIACIHGLYACMHAYISADRQI